MGTLTRRKLRGPANEILWRNVFWLQVKVCTPEIVVTGHQCTFEGRLPKQDRVIKVTSWGPCEDLTDVHAFVSTIGVCRMFIRTLHIEHITWSK